MHPKKIKKYIKKIKEILFLNSLNNFLTILLISTIFILSFSLLIGLFLIQNGQLLQQIFHYLPLGLFQKTRDGDQLFGLLVCY